LSEDSVDGWEKVSRVGINMGARKNISGAF